MVISFHQVIDDAISVLMALGCEMEVDHGRAQTVVAQVLLDASDVYACLQQVGGIRMSKRMYGDAFSKFKLFQYPA